jgi:heat shock protein HtpX
MNLYDQQAANRRRTWLVMAVFVVFLLLLGVGFDFFFVSASGAFAPIGSVTALGLGSISSMVSYFAGDRAVLASTQAASLDTLVQQASGDDLLELRQLQNVVTEMAIASGLPRPPVYVVPDDDPNAFATGRGPGHSSIAVTRGLLRVLNREELQGVIAHEMSHIRNYDVRLMTIVAALVGTIALLADWTSRVMWYGGGTGRAGRSDKDDKGRGALVVLLFAFWVIAIVLAPLLSRLLAMMVSRQREYLADASGAELTRNPLGLAMALTKIDDAAAPTRAIKQGSAHLCIADPLGRRLNLQQGFLANLFASHPPMAARIEALRAMALGGAR